MKKLNEEGVDLYYVDESYDSTAMVTGRRLFVLSSIMVPVEDWHDCFDRVQAFRKSLNKAYGIPVRKELHARDLVGGRKMRIKGRTVAKSERRRIFRSALDMISQLPGVQVTNVCLPMDQHIDPYTVAFNRILNRMEAAQGKKRRFHLIICDEGKEKLVKGLARKLRKFNFIPSKYGTWGQSGKTKNIPIRWLIEDPVFRDSADSYFVQLVDFVAFSLLRKENPTPSVAKYRLNMAFSALGRVLNKDASDDPEGIVRK